MTRKRFMKLAMSEGMTKNEADHAAFCAHVAFCNYAEAYEYMNHTIRGRYEFFMPGREKIVAKRNRHYADKH